MSRRALPWIAAAALLATGLLLWIAARDERLANEPPSTVRAPAAAPAPIPQLPAPALAADPPALTDPVPLVPATTAETAAAAAIGESASTTAIIVTVRIDGDPLLPVLHKLGIEYQDVHVLATLDAPGASLDESLAPNYARQGLGEFTPHRNDWNEDTVVGPDRCLGELEVPIRFPLHVSVALGSAVLATRKLHAPQPELTIELSAETLAARLGKLRARIVSAATQEPIAGGRLVLGPVAFFMPNTTATADEQGVIEQRAVPGPTWLAVTADGFEELVLVARVRRGEICDLGDLALHPAGIISGFVRLANGEPVSGAKIMLLPPDSKVDALQLVGMQLSMAPPEASEGQFTVPCGRRRYLLVATNLDQTAVVPVDARSGHVLGVDVTLEEMHLLTVMLPSDSLGSLRLRVWTQDKLPVASWPGWTGDRDDEAMILPLVPGDYVLAIDSAKDGQSTRAVQMMATHSVTIDLSR